MRLKVIGTGSKGNCYILEAGEEKLILDLGVSDKIILKELNFDISNVAGAIVTHCHRDHSLSEEKMRKLGIPVYAPYKTGEELRTKQLGNFKVKSFELPHDGTVNRGFLIMADGQKVLYMTDFEYCKYNFKSMKVDHMLIECNYQRKYVEEASVNFIHKVKGHASLDYAKQFVEQNKTDALRNVLLIHRGVSTTNPIECVDEVKKVAGAGINVVMAEKGTVMELQDVPF